MSQTPVPQDPGRDGNPSRVPSWPAWMDDPAYPPARAEDEDSGDLDEYADLITLRSSWMTLSWPR